MSEPTAFPVLLMECFLAGFQYHEAAKYWDHLPIGETLGLAREPGNPHDPRAVRVHWLGATLGYLPREANFTVSQMLDREEYVEARITGKRLSADPATRILLEVIAMANPSRGLPSLYDTRPEDEVPVLKQLATEPPNPLLRGLAWMLAGRVIGKAKT